MSNFVICWSIWIIFWYLCFSFHLISMWRTIKSINWPHKKKICVSCVPQAAYVFLWRCRHLAESESQSVTADGIMLRYIRFPAKVWHYYDSVYHSCFTAHELCRKAIPHELIVYFLKLPPVFACLTWRRHEPYIRFPAKVWHDYASVHHSCFTAHELCRKAIPPSW